jgi:hypothetical protein
VLLPMVVVSKTNHGCFYVGPFVGAYGISRRCEQTNLRTKSFFISPNVWTKFSIRHPGVSYANFLAYRAQRYEVWNKVEKRFFAEFSKDRIRRDSILRECAARRAARRLATGPFVGEGSVPKAKPIKEGIISPPIMSI